MSGFFVQRDGFIEVSDLIASIVSDMTSNGFVQKFPASPLTNPPPSVFKVTLEATPAVDALAATQPWRVHFDVIDDFQAKMYVASDIQLPDDGTISKLERGLSLTAADSAGVIGSDLPYPYKQDATTVIVPPPDINTGQTYTAASIWRTKRINNADSQFIDRSIRIPDLQTAQSYPMSYTLAISDHGFHLCVWEEAQDPTGNKFSWVVVQRPVDRVTGAPLVDTSTKCPLFCVYGLKDMYIPAAIFDASKTTSQSDVDQVIIDERWESGLKKFVVRERDVLKPTPSVPASYDTEDSNAIINDDQQVCITEDNKYVITFPNKLNTPRYAYTHELDMIAYTSADVVSQYTEVPLTVYGESSPRIYKALLANKPNNTGVRILTLKQGGGIS